MARDDSDAFDYLGERQPLSRPRLSVTSGTGGAVTAPVTPGASPGVGGGGTVTPGRSATTPTTPGFNPLSLGIKGAQLASKLIPADAAPLAIDTPAPGAEFANEVASGSVSQADVFNPAVGATPTGASAAGLTAADADLAAAAEFGATGAETAAGIGLAEILPFAGAALKGGLEIAGNKPDEQKALDLGLDAAGLGIGFLAGGPLGAGIGLLGASIVEEVLGYTVFNQPSHYDAVRGRASKEAGRDLGALATDYAKATGDPASVLTSLKSSEGGRGAVRSLVNLPPDVAQAVGVSPGQHEWGDFTPEQFTALVNAARGQDWSSWFKGSGDVAYLNQSQAQQVADQAANSGRALFQEALAFQPPQTAGREPDPGAPATGTPQSTGLNVEGPSGALGFAKDLLEP